MSGNSSAAVAVAAAVVATGIAVATGVAAAEVTAVGVAEAEAAAAAVAWGTGELTIMASLGCPGLIRRDTLRWFVPGVELPLTGLESFKLMKLGLGALPGVGLIGEAGGLDTLWERGSKTTERDEGERGAEEARLREAISKGMLRFW